jgi:hypothetical protein
MGMRNSYNFTLKLPGVSSRLEDYINVDLLQIVPEGVDWIRIAPSDGFFCATLCSIKNVQFLDVPSDYRLPKKDYATWNSLVSAV